MYIYIYIHMYVYIYIHINICLLIVYIHIIIAGRPARLPDDLSLATPERLRRASERPEDPQAMMARGGSE